MVAAGAITFFVGFLIGCLGSFGDHEPTVRAAGVLLALGVVLFLIGS